MKKQEKIQFTKNLAESLQKATAYILIDFTGLTMPTQQELKTRLEEAGSRMLVVKNTLFARAGREVKAPKEILADTVLSGQTALVVTNEDPVSPVQILGKFQEEFETPQFKVGVIEGAFQNKEGLVKLSHLPSKEVLLSQVVGGIAAPAYGLIAALNSNLQNLVYVLETASQKGGD